MANIITAPLKFFNQKKGFGFFSHEEGRDIFVHASIVRASGFDTKGMLTGVEATFEFETTGEKKQATSIQKLGGLSPSKSAMEQAKRPRRQGKAKPAGVDAKIDAFHVASVKFFNEEKGFGFLEVIDENVLNDLFVHISDVPGDLQPPQEGDLYDVCVEAKNGKLRALVLQRHTGEHADKQAA